MDAHAPWGQQDFHFLLKESGSKQGPSVFSGLRMRDGVTMVLQFRARLFMFMIACPVLSAPSEFRARLFMSTIACHVLSVPSESPSPPLHYAT